MAIVIVDENNVESIPESQIKSVLLQLGILKDENKDPINDMACAWELLQSFIWGNLGFGFSLDVKVTDAINGYGCVERWGMAILEYEEWCVLCGKDYQRIEIRDGVCFENAPKHQGRHKWKQEWAMHSGSEAFTPQLAICKTLIKHAMTSIKNGALENTVFSKRETNANTD